MASDHTESPRSPVRAASTASGISPMPTWMRRSVLDQRGHTQPDGRGDLAHGAAGDGGQLLLHVDGHVDGIDVQLAVTVGVGHVTD